MDKINQEFQRDILWQIEHIIRNAKLNIDRDLIDDLESLQKDIKRANHKTKSIHGKNNREAIVLCDDYIGEESYSALVKTPELMDYLEGRVDVPSEALLDQLSVSGNFQASGRDEIRKQLNTFPTRNHVTGYKIDSRNLSVRPRMLFEFGYQVLVQKQGKEVYCYGLQNSEYFAVSGKVINIRGDFSSFFSGDRSLF